MSPSTASLAAGTSSFAPNVASRDADAFLEAAQLVEAAFASSGASGSLGTSVVDPAEVASIVRKAARKNGFLSGFVDRTSRLLNDSSSSEDAAAYPEPTKPADAACLLLLSKSLDMRSKLEIMHRVLQKDWVKVMTVVLASIAACCCDASSSYAEGGADPDHQHNHHRVVIVEGKPSEAEDDGEDPPGHPSRPSKRPKHGEEQGVHTCKSPSFDSSLATLRDEDDHSRGNHHPGGTPPSSTTARDVRDVALHLVDHLVSTTTGGRDAVTAGSWVNWHKAGGGHESAPWLELLEDRGWKKRASSTSASPGSLSSENRQQPKGVSPSPTLISFDFSSQDARSSSLLIDISEENLLTLRQFVSTTELWHHPASEMCKALLSVAKRRPDEGTLVISRSAFLRAVDQFLPPAMRSSELVRRVLEDFFSLYELPSSSNSSDCAELKELAVGMCFFCAGTKSVKLATAFELLDEQRLGYLAEQQLFGYLRSYLLALVALSLLVKANQNPMSQARREGIRLAVESGARWTLSHYTSCGMADSNRFTFESFAGWYSNGGFSVAPWLELLDLSKTLALIPSDGSSQATMTPLPLPAFSQHPSTAGTAPMTISTTSHSRTDRISSLRRHHSARNSQCPPEVLFSFPLAANRFLVVLKDDASYVRDVVETLGLLSSTPDDLWMALSKCVSKHQRPVSADEPTVYVNCSTFLECMNDGSVVDNSIGRKRGAPGEPEPRDELLCNFFHCFDVGQCDRVALDELMGGLALLCGGKKSMKLSFAFTIFDTRTELRKKKKDSITHSLSGEDLFLFLRSVLIVMFSCCRQSLDMTDVEVSQCISDTANMICNDVMRHQWETKQTNRCNFDEFGQWYNDGGFERAPWLELLDLRKWVLLESQPVKQPSHPPTPKEADIPPPPPEDELDASFFEDNGIMPMDSMDEMDMMLMPAPSTDRELDAGGFRINKSFSFSPRSRAPSQEPLPNPPLTPSSQSSPLKFHLITRESHGGYRVSCSRSRINLFRQVLEFCGLQNSTVEDACNAFLSKASRQGKADAEPRITREGFYAALKLVSSWRPKSQVENQRILTGLFDSIFAAFDRDGSGKPSVIEVACGMTVLCQGKKSDKLEFAFEVLDKNKRGLLSKQDMSKYLQSFLTVLMSVSMTPALSKNSSSDCLSTMDGSLCEVSVPSLQRAVSAGADWAAEQAFREFDGGRKKNGSMSFDDFAEWYTTRGFGSIPWLELIDLRKWSANS